LHLQEGVKLFEENRQSWMNVTQNLNKIFAKIDHLIHSFNTMPNENIDINIQKCNKIFELIDNGIEEMIRFSFLDPPLASTFDHVN